MRRSDRKRGGFTLLEIMIALGVFMLAVVGIAKAVDTALQAALEARQRTQCREELESRIAYCLADPPAWNRPRILEAGDNHGVRVEERLEPYGGRNAQGKELPGLGRLEITTRSGAAADSAQILLNRP
jgi:type II secretory pathway component PulJ